MTPQVKSSNRLAFKTPQNYGKFCKYTNVIDKKCHKTQNISICLARNWQRQRV